MSEEKPPMLIEDFAPEGRALKSERIDADLVVVGGGLAGTCAAITAARAGIKVALVQDRPVLGGNGSSEVRLWALGATAHMGNNNRWSREGGVINELMVENLYRNREGNSLIFDTIMLEKVMQEPNITLLLNTAAFALEKSDPNTVKMVRTFCSQNSTEYELYAPLFCDASGDGITAFQAGAAFRMGAESKEEFGELFAPTGEYGYLLGHSIYFYSKDMGQPVKFVPPSYALDDVTVIPRWRSFNTKEQGCRLWWIEYGGRLDTVHETENIKWQLWEVVYGVWNYIKNSGNFPDAENLTLEWVGHIPGKRESRRFEGPYMLIQQDVIEQRQHYDAVSHGGWSIDLHPADGVFSEMSGSHHVHSRGVYQIPYRTMFSRNIKNLFLAGRILSASHVAFGTTRVMTTLAEAGQAAGQAAAICIREGVLPADVAEAERMKVLQRELLRSGQYIPQVPLEDPDDLLQSATVNASSKLCLESLPADGPVKPLEHSWGQWLPLQAGKAPQFTVTVDVEQATTLQIDLRTSNRPDNYTPDVLLGSQKVDLQPGPSQAVTVSFDTEIDQPRYVLLAALQNPAVAIHTSTQLVTGLVSVRHRGTQTDTEKQGGEAIEFWTPERRPGGQNLALQIEPGVDGFDPINLRNGYTRPTAGANAWAAALDDPHPKLSFEWEAAQAISKMVLQFDVDYDHAMETVQFGHPEDVVPFCVKHYRVLDANGKVVAEEADNHQAINTLIFDPPLQTDTLQIEVVGSHGKAPVAIFDVRCYA